jgi:hypothetical protein
MVDAAEHGAEIIQHKAGYNNVLAARAEQDVRGRRGWVHVPQWLRCKAAVAATAAQVAHIPGEVQRVVVVAGSGVTLAGVLLGLQKQDLNLPVLGVSVGACPRKTIASFAPFGGYAVPYRVVDSGVPYGKPATATHLGGIRLDGGYEAKCLPFLEDGDLLWVAGFRNVVEGG